jgi:RNA polymerase sigma-70 factor (ECF subfamily)
MAAVQHSERSLSNAGHWGASILNERPSRRQFCPALREGEADDFALIRRTRSGGKASFDELVRRHRQLVYRTALRIVKDTADAEDVTQETFVRAFTHLEQFKGISRFSTWLVRIALNCAWMNLRRSAGVKRKSVELDGLSIAGTLMVDEPNPEQLYRLRERASVLWTLIDRLSLADRALLKLRIDQDLSIQQIATILNISAAAVKTRLFRAKRRLSAELLRSHPASAHPPVLTAA